MPSLDRDSCRDRFAAARVAVLATHGDADAIDLVPVTFALTGELLVSAVDHKPKRTPHLRRLANVRARPDVSLLVDRYDPDWDRLWWVRAHGTATVIEPGHPCPEEVVHAVDLLIDRYPAYQDQAPEGALVVVRIDRWVGWEAAAPP